jgi:hypothetical protein
MTIFFIPKTGFSAEKELQYWKSFKNLTCSYKKKLDLDAKIRTQFNRNIALPNSKKENVKFEDLKTNKLLNQQCFCRKGTNQNVDILQKPYLLLCIKSKQGAQILGVKIRTHFNRNVEATNFNKQVLNLKMKMKKLNLWLCKEQIPTQRTQLVAWVTSNTKVPRILLFV